MMAQSEMASRTLTLNLTGKDVRQALAAGWQDFAANPIFGLFFAAFYVAGGLALVFGLTSIGQGWWLIPVMAGFPLLAPFSAVGLYEVSRRREAGLSIGWRGVLGALGGRGDEQLILMGAIVFVAFSFWMILAHGIFAIFLGNSGIGAQSGALLLSLDAIMMLLVGGAVGGVFALALFAITVITIFAFISHHHQFTPKWIR